MNIFVIGPSRSAKTPISNMVAQALSFKTIAASDWVRNIYVPSFSVETMEDKQRVIEEITLLSQHLLKEDPNRCIDYIRSHHPDLDVGSYVLEGFRNPRDFLTLFNPKNDLLVVLKFPASPLRPLTFETEGLQIIEQTFNWFGKCGISPASSGMMFTIADFHQVELIAKAIVTWVNNVRTYVRPRQP